ncbi:TPA: prepilin peptidase, partial [Escherichia coli]
LIVLGAAFRYSQEELTYSLLNASLWFSMTYLLRQFFITAKGTEALGLGDVFLIAGIAMWTQPQHTPLIIAGAASGAFLFILIFCRRRRLSRHCRSPRFSAHHCMHLPSSLIPFSALRRYSREKVQTR